MRSQPSEKSEKAGTELTHYAELCEIFDRAAIGPLKMEHIPKKLTKVAGQGV
jgi:hypothetical protein